MDETGKTPETQTSEQLKNDATQTTAQPVDASVEELRKQLDKERMEKNMLRNKLEEEERRKQEEADKKLAETSGSWTTNPIVCLCICTQATEFLLNSRVLTYWILSVFWIRILRTIVRKCAKFVFGIFLDFHVEPVVYCKYRDKRYE